MDSSFKDYESLTHEQLVEECKRLHEELRREKRGWWATVAILMLAFLVFQTIGALRNG